MFVRFAGGVAFRLQEILEDLVSWSSDADGNSLIWV